MVRLLVTLSLLTGSAVISGHDEAYLSLLQLPGGAFYYQVAPWQQQKVQLPREPGSAVRQQQLQPVTSSRPWQGQAQKYGTDLLMVQSKSTMNQAVPSQQTEAHAARSSSEALPALKFRGIATSPPQTTETNQLVPSAAVDGNTWALPRPPLSSSGGAWALPPSPAPAAAKVATAAGTEDLLHAAKSTAQDEELAALRQENELLNQEETWRASEGLQLRKEAAELRRGGELLLRENEFLRRNYTQLWLQHEQAARQGAGSLERTPLTYEVRLDRGEPPLKSKAVLAIIEAVGLGIFGVDRCYMGDMTLGIVKGVTFGGFIGWAVLDYFVVLVNSIEKADVLDVLRFNATFREKVFLDASSEKKTTNIISGETTTHKTETTEIQAAFYIMVLSYSAFFAGELLLCLHFKLSPEERASQTQMLMQQAARPFPGYAQQGPGQYQGTK